MAEFPDEITLKVEIPVWLLALVGGVLLGLALSYLPGLLATITPGPGPTPAPTPGPDPTPKPKPPFPSTFIPRFGGSDRV